MAPVLLARLLRQSDSGNGLEESGDVTTVKRLVLIFLLVLGMGVAGAAASPATAITSITSTAS